MTLIVIPTTILLTLFAANLMGYTINRVSLFALIFSIGILVDDAIVVVENIARHWDMNDGRTRLQAAIAAVAEVGNPTVVATLTVIAALLPMLFVSGHDGTIHGAHSRQCVGGDAVFLLRRDGCCALGAAETRRQRKGPAAGRTPHRRRHRKILSPPRHTHRRLKEERKAVPRLCRHCHGSGVHVVRHQGRDREAAAVRQQIRTRGDGRFAAKAPALEDTARVLFEAAAITEGLPEVRSIQAYAGTPAPFNFNGLVRHYYLRDYARAGGTPSQSGATNPTATAKAMRLRSICAASWMPSACPRAR